MQRVDTVERATFDRDADDGQRGHCCDHPWQVRCATSTSHDHSEPARRRRPGVLDEPVGCTVCRDDRQLVRHVEAIEDARGGEHHRQVRVRAHDDANQGLSMRVPFHGRDRNVHLKVGILVLVVVPAVVMIVAAREMPEKSEESGADFRVRVGGHGYVAHFAALATLGLTVEVHACAGHGEGAFGEVGDFWHVVRRAEDVEHGGGGYFEGSRADGEREDGAEVVFVL